MNNSVYIYHLANALNMIAWLVTDILWVRTLAVCGNAITIHFEKHELSLYKLSFAGLSPCDFRKLLRHAHRLITTESATLALKVVPLDEVSIIVSGSAVVSVDGHLVSELVAGNLIGEISFMYGGPATADVVTSSPSVIAQWKKDQLQHLLSRNPAISGS